MAIDGISLTVARFTDDGFEVSVIPHTGGQTTLLGKRVGDVVNLENDVVGKYVGRLLEGALGREGPPGERVPDAGLTLDRLRALGF